MARLAELQAQLAQATEEYNSTRTRYSGSGRPLGPAEQGDLNRLNGVVRSLEERVRKAQEDANMSASIEQAAAGMYPPHDRSGSGSMRRNTDGRRVVATPALQAVFKNKDSLSDSPWNSGSSELPDFWGTTLTEDIGSGGGLIGPHYVPGVLYSPTRPVVMADLIAPGQTDSNLVSYTKEVSYTNASAAVLEAGTKPESTLVFTAATSPVRKLAHWIPITSEMLEDQTMSASIIDSRLRTGLGVTEDDQILNGSGVAPNLLGFLNLTGLTTAQARGADTNADAVLKQVANVRTATNLAPDAIVMHPTNWQTIQLTKAADGTYLSGLSPFSAPVGPTLWGLRVVLTTAIPVNTALVGCFQTAAQLFRRGGLRVEASNSHANFFIENKVALRAEERLALAVYREAAFGKVTGLN